MNTYSTLITVYTTMYIPIGLLSNVIYVGRSNITHVILSLALETLAQANRFIVSYQRQDLNVPLDVEYQEVVVTGDHTEIVKKISIPGVMYLVSMWAVNGSQYTITPSSFGNQLQLGQGEAYANKTTSQYYMYTVVNSSKHTYSIYKSIYLYFQLPPNQDSSLSLQHSLKDYSSTGYHQNNPMDQFYINSTMEQIPHSSLQFIQLVMTPTTTYLDYNRTQHTTSEWWLLTI